MKKDFLTALVIGFVCFGASGQGSLNIDSYVVNDPGVTTEGANAASTTAATTWFTGTVSLEVFALASATDAQLNAINSYLNTVGGFIGGSFLLASDGFVEISTTTLTGSTVGSLIGAVSDGSLDFNPSAIGLSDAVTTDAPESLALYVTAIGGTYSGWSGVIAFNNNTGGNPNAAPIPGTAANLTGWGALNENLVLSGPVPEPTTMALAGLGSLSLFLFRRKK